MASALGENINIGGVTFFAGEDVILELTLYVRLSISIAGWVTLHDSRYSKETF